MGARPIPAGPSKKDGALTLLPRPTIQKAQITIVDALCLSKQTSNFPAANYLRHPFKPDLNSNDDQTVYASLIQHNNPKHMT